MRQLGFAPSQAAAPTLLGDALSAVDKLELCKEESSARGGGSSIPPPLPHSLVKGTRQHAQSIRAEGQAFYGGVVSTTTTLAFWGTDTSQILPRAYVMDDVFNACIR